MRDKAIEAAARVHCDYFGGDGLYDAGTGVDSHQSMIEAMRLAIAAYLRNVTVSEAVSEAGARAYYDYRPAKAFSNTLQKMTGLGPDDEIPYYQFIKLGGSVEGIARSGPSIFQAMCAAHADELEKPQ